MSSPVRRATTCKGLHLNFFLTQSRSCQLPGPRYYRSATPEAVPSLRQAPRGQRRQGESDPLPHSAVPSAACSPTPRHPDRPLIAGGSTKVGIIGTADGDVALFGFSSRPVVHGPCPYGWRLANLRETNHPSFLPCHRGIRLPPGTHVEPKGTA